MHSGILRARQVAVFLFFLLSLTLLACRLIFLQIFEYPFYKKVANEQHTIAIELPPTRGTIFDRNMQILAVNLHCDSVYANPREVVNKRRTAALLSSVLHVPEAPIAQRLFRDKSFIWIKRKISPQESAAIKKLKLDGVGLIQESKRFYPNKSLACHVLGLVNIDNTGLEGVELLYNNYLKGESGLLISSQDARRKLLKSYRDEYISPKNGFSLILTIDEVIQTIAERELRKMCEKYHAKAGSIIVMNPLNGDILALANFPSFDMNNVGTRSVEAIRNRAINDFFEPGSVFKIVTASAALQENLVDFNTRFFCENGEWNLKYKILHDVHPYGILTFKEVIEKSSNIGTVKVAALLGPERLHQYITALGFARTTGIDLPGEVAGIVHPVARWSKSSMSAIPMGQGITVTALQLVRAIAVIADNGYLVRPRIVKEVIDEDGETIKDFPPKVGERAITSATVFKMRSILKGVVENGTGKKAKIDEYQTAGKTGTAQKVDPGGVYSHSRFIGSFIGFAPVERPVLAVAVCIDEPRVVYYGGDVAAPVFKNVVEESLRYLNARSTKPLL